MAVRFFAAILVFFLFSKGLEASVPLQFLHTSSFPKAISGLKEAVEKALGAKGKGWEISGFDAREALVGQSMVYEFHVEVDNQVYPIRLLEDVNWSEVVGSPGFGAEGGKEVAEMGRMREGGFPVLPPFQLAGPLELWIKDGDDMRLSLPHDVEAGVLKKVILSDGAVVTVKGARSVNLRHPVELPLPLKRSGREEAEHGEASGLLDLAEALQDASRSNEKTILSLRIEGPSSLTSSSPSSSNDKARLKLKRLAPGLVQLSSPVSAVSTLVETEKLRARTLWPLVSFNGSNMNLRGIEQLLDSVLGEKSNKDGIFRLLKTQVSARTYVKLSFKMTKKLSDGEVDWSGFPGWRTRPEQASSHFEVLASVKDNGEVMPEKIAEVQPFHVEDSILDSVLTGNMTMSKLPVHYPPPSLFTL